MQIICTVDIRTRELALEDVTIAAFDHLVDDILFDVEPIDGFELDTSTIKIAAVGPLGEQHDYEIDASTVTVDEETGNINFIWSIPVGVTAMPLSSFKINDIKKITFAVCAEIVSGDNLVKAWHSNDGTIKVKAHLEPESGGGETPEEQATNAQKIGQLQTDVAVVQRAVAAVAGGTPTVVDSISDMTDTNKIYVLSTDSNWYYYDGTSWTSGGQYGGATTSTTFNQHGVPADDFAVGEALADKADADDLTEIDTRVTAVEGNVDALSATVEAKADDADVVAVQSDLDKFKSGIETLDGEWQIGNMDKTTVYPNVKYKVCNPTIQLFDRDITLHIESGYYLNLNYFDEEGTRTASWNNRTGTHTVPSGQRFNVIVTENPVDTTLVITDIARFVNAVTFSTVLEERIGAVETATGVSDALVNSLNDGNTFITDEWQVGQLDKTTVYPNLKKYTLSNPVIRSFDSDILIHVKSGFKYTLNYFDAEGTRTSIISNVTLDRTIKARQRFNLFVTRNPVDESEVITEGTKIEFENAVYFRCVLGQEVDKLKASVDPIADPPDYYFDNDYLPNKCTAIDTLAKTCAANGDIFIFITDEHWTLNEKKSPALLRYISKHCNLSMLFDGGDNDDYGSPAFSTALRNSFTRKIHYVAGNHDWFPPTDGNMLYYWNDMQNNDQIGNPVEHYYYVDNVQKNIRYIVLNAWVNNSGTLVSGYSAEQLTWFTNTALDAPDGWDIIVFSHYVGNTVTSAPSGARDFRDAIDAYNADVSHTGQVIAIITGHTHADFVCHTAGGVPIIATTCDKNKGNGAGNETWLQQYRPNGTIYEQAFDVMFLDRSAKKITALRIGCPAMDNTDISSGDTGFDYSPTLEQRVINYA